MTARHRINQGIECRPQSRVDFGQLLATTAQTADPRGDGFVGVRPAMFQVAYSRSDRVPRQTRSDGDGRDATPTQCHGFGGGPLSSHSLVHHWSQREEFLSNPFRRGRVLHATRVQN